MKTIIPMAGRGSRFTEAGYKEFKPFLPICGKPMIERVVENVKEEGSDVILITREEYADRLKEPYITVKEVTEGAACTVLLAERHIEGELLIANSDQLVDIDINDFLREARKYDACIMTFKSDHPKWSYAKVSDGLVTEVAEKNPISDHATVGIYYYKNGQDFIKAAKRMIEDNFRVNNEFYVCPVYNWYPRDKKIGIYEIKEGDMYGLGDPKSYEANSTRVCRFIK